MNVCKLWLNFQPTNGLPAWTGVLAGDPQSLPGKTALRELADGLAELRGKPVETVACRTSLPCLLLNEEAGDGESWTLSQDADSLILSGGGRGLLYGAFRLLRALSSGDPLPIGTLVPAYPLRMLNHWDNADGSIERGYSGNSFFFQNGEPVCTERTKAYARLISSCGLNASVINNVNVHENAKKLLTGEYVKTLKEIADLFQSYGISLWISVSFAAPIELGGLDTADPLDVRVRAWWKTTAARLWAAIPSFGGFLVKADSEGQPGPHTYGRSQADGANMLAEAVEPYHGRILWRCFVYNCTQDWRDTKTDRARAQFDNFAPLDGQFRPNVLLQLKNGPVDFQIREPVSPLFGSLPNTNTILEFQIAQEYTGQQRHVCYLMPMFREVLDFRLHARSKRDSVAETVCAVTAVSNTGDDPNWTGHDLAAANLFGYGCLAWDPTSDPLVIASEWSRLTFGRDPAVTETVTGILMASYKAYEDYTVPLGIGWMCNPPDHYGPSPEGYEYDRWGTYHRATCREIGVERGPSGTGYTEQYHEPLASLYRNVKTCPEELLLFFHRLPYDYRLKDGRTLIQYVYDTHFEGCASAEQMAQQWASLQGRVPDDLFLRVTERFREQVRSAREWRDVINSWFYRLTQIPDEHGRELYI